MINYRLFWQLLEILRNMLEFLRLKEVLGEAATVLHLDVLRSCLRCPSAPDAWMDRGVLDQSMWERDDMWEGWLQLLAAALLAVKQTAGLDFGHLGCTWTYRHYILDGTKTAWYCREKPSFNHQYRPWNGCWVGKKMYTFAHIWHTHLCISLCSSGNILPIPGEAKAKVMPGRLYIHTK